MYKENVSKFIIYQLHEKHIWYGCKIFNFDIKFKHRIIVGSRWLGFNDISDKKKIFNTKSAHKKIPIQFKSMITFLIVRVASVAQN